MFIIKSLTSILYYYDDLIFFRNELNYSIISKYHENLDENINYDIDNDIDIKTPLYKLRIGISNDLISGGISCAISSGIYFL